MWHHVSALLRSPDKVVERFSNPTSDTLEEDIRSAERDVKKWQRRSERLIGIFVQEVITEAEFEHQRRFVVEPLEAAEERVGRLTAQRERALAATGAGDAFTANLRKYLYTLGVDPALSPRGRRAAGRRGSES